MGATTVTGQSGRGIAYGTRGPGNKRNYFTPSVAPHIVAAGLVTCAGGTTTVIFSDPLGPSTVSAWTGKYAIFVQAEVGTAIVITRVYDLISTSPTYNQLTGFTFTGPGSGIASWMVVNLGQGADVVAGQEVNNLVGTTVATNL